jgi:glycosyltransferase involved in cell wall biosynthesis
MKKIRILFFRDVDRDLVNAQSLNTREIVLRLDSELFECTMFYSSAPDPRLTGRSNLKLVKLPRRAKTFTFLKECFAGYDLIAYLDYSPASYLFMKTSRWLRRRPKTVIHAEAPYAQMKNPSWLQLLLCRGVLSKCDVCTGITDYVAEDISRVSGHKARYVLPVGVDCASFTPPDERSNAIPVVLFVGTVIERKGVGLVLESATAFPQARFRIVGAGRDGYDSYLAGRVRARKLINVSLEGPRSQAEIAKAMRESDVLVLPSRLEGLPKVTLEAAASGLPCIVFRDYETPSVVDGVTGYQVDTQEEIVQRLSALLSSSELRKKMGAAARQHAASFDWNVISKKWADAYHEISAGAEGH